MDNFLNKFFFRSRNLDYISQNIQDITNHTPANKVFEAMNSYSENSEVRYVGGCIRKIINKEHVDDIDLATNLNPNEVCEALKRKNIDFYETGIEHGTVTAIIDKHKYEITSLRKDIATDGRHAKVEFSLDWKEDAARRDFSINSIYSDGKGNLFDPNNGKKDLEDGLINFIGHAESRIKEDYLRILRYIRFFLNYSNSKHNSKIIKIIKKNLSGFSNISSERLLDEFQKLFRSKKIFKLAKDKDCIEIINLIFPQLKNISMLNRLNSFARNNFFKVDFIILLSLMIIDGTDNVEYFIYKFNLSKKNKKRILFLNDFYSQKITTNSFSEKNMNKILYFNGREAIMDVIFFKIFKSVKIDNRLLKIIEIYKDKKIPIMPFKANILMEKYNISEGKELGVKLKKLEEAWINNNFQISDNEVRKILDN